MIKINLLGAAAPKPKARAVAQVSKAKQLGTFLGALVVSFGIVGLVYLIWSSSVASLKVELKKQQAEQARLAAIKQENARYEHERSLLEQRIQTIQVLRTGRVGPTEFMNALGNVANRTPNDLYFFSVAPQGERVVIHGQAGSANSVAGLMTTMKTSGYFQDVQLRQFYEDDQQSLISYKFNMDCGYKSPSAAVSPTQASAGAKAATPPPRPGL
jgi:Tfp pilus assembly protein PilN